MILLVITASAFALLALAWLAYPAAMWLRAGRRSTLPPVRSTPTERVAVIVATRDDPAYALERVRNLRAGEYPPHLLRVVVGVDANAPYPLEAYGTALAGQADAVPGDPAGGKAATLNAAVRAASGADIFAFADVGQEFNHAAIPLLVDALADGTRGAVTGRYTHGRTDGIMSAYADLEAIIRSGQSAGRSVVSATGAIFALRPVLWRELPNGLICDDLFTGLSVVRQGSRVAFCPEAVAYDHRSFSRDQQFARRVRTLTGLIQYCMIQPGALFPWRNPVWGHFFIHKILRLLTPLLFASGAAAFAIWFAYRAPIPTLAVLAGTTAAALLVWLVAPARFRHLLDQVSWALRLMVVPMMAISNGLHRRWTVWAPTSQVRANLHPGA
jgi:cellulose synthase/poly-beta-1,6-N-acetylglucosamine synthase-like glycosyltransferase